MTVAVRDEYEPKFGRQHLTLWSGAFASGFTGWATELPKHNGFMITLDDITSTRKVRVECESPRTDQNYERVDAAIDAAVERANWFKRGDAVIYHAPESPHVNGMKAHVLADPFYTQDDDGENKLGEPYLIYPIQVQGGRGLGGYWTAAKVRRDLNPEPPVWPID